VFKVAKNMSSLNLALAELSLVEQDVKKQEQIGLLIRKYFYPKDSIKELITAAREELEGWNCEEDECTFEERTRLNNFMEEWFGKIQRG